MKLKSVNLLVVARGIAASAMAPKVQMSTVLSRGSAEGSLTNETNFPGRSHQASAPLAHYGECELPP